jgi:hypothetical protein
MKTTEQSDATPPQQAEQRAAPEAVAQIDLLAVHGQGFGGLTALFERSAGNAPAVVHIQTGGMVHTSAALHPVLALLAGQPTNGAVNVNGLIGLRGSMEISAQPDGEDVVVHLVARLRRRA